MIRYYPHLTYRKEIQAVLRSYAPLGQSEALPSPVRDYASLLPADVRFVWSSLQKDSAALTQKALQRIQTDSPSELLLVEQMQEKRNEAKLAQVQGDATAEEAVRSLVELEANVAHSIGVSPALAIYVEAVRLEEAIQSRMPVVYERLHSDKGRLPVTGELVAYPIATRPGPRLPSLVSSTKLEENPRLSDSYVDDMLAPSLAVSNYLESSGIQPLTYEEILLEESVLTQMETQELATIVQSSESLRATDYTRIQERTHIIGYFNEEAQVFAERLALTEDLFSEFEEEDAYLYGYQTLEAGEAFTVQNLVNDLPAVGLAESDAADYLIRRWGEESKKRLTLLRRLARMPNKLEQSWLEEEILSTVHQKIADADVIERLHQRVLALPQDHPIHLLVAEVIETVETRQKRYGALLEDSYKWMQAKYQWDRAFLETLRVAFRLRALMRATNVPEVERFTFDHEVEKEFIRLYMEDWA